jgi:hypothetical protein
VGKAGLEVEKAREVSDGGQEKKSKSGERDNVQP